MKLLPTHVFAPDQLYIIIQDNIPRIVRWQGDSIRWEKLPDDPIPLKECFVNKSIAYELMVSPMKLTLSQFHGLHHDIRDLQEQIADSMDQPISMGKVECTTFPEAADFRMAVRARLRKELKELLTFPVPTCSQF